MGSRSQMASRCSLAKALLLRFLGFRNSIAKRCIMVSNEMSPLEPLGRSLPVTSRTWRCVDRSGKLWFIAPVSTPAGGSSRYTFSRSHCFRCCVGDDMLSPFRQGAHPFTQAPLQLLEQREIVSAGDSSAQCSTHNLTPACLEIGKPNKVL